MDKESTDKVICMLMCLPDGIQAMSADIAGLVQTSLNMGILATSEQEVRASFCVRSSVDSQKEMLRRRLLSFMTQLGGKIEVRGDYSGWQYQEEWPLRERMIQVFEEQ